MVTLTTQQRDLLHLLLTADSPLTATEIGRRIELKPRQVHYILGAVRDWLARHDVALQNIPGVGAQVRCSPAQRQRLLIDLQDYARLQLVLSAEQRQQLLIFTLLSAAEPLVIQRLQDAMAVSRSTVLKDMDAVEPWLAGFGLELVRRQHAGSWLVGRELAMRQALAALLWGEAPGERPIFSIEHDVGLTCALLTDADLLPALGPVRDLVAACDLKAQVAMVSRVEADLGWRYSDESALYIALALCIQSCRSAIGRHASCDVETLDWLRGRAVWAAAEGLTEGGRADEAAAAAMLLMSCPHEGGVATPELRDLIDAALNLIARSYAIDALRDDVALREGLQAQLCTAALAARFGIWLPARSADDLPAESGEAERQLTERIATLFFEQSGARLAARHRQSLTLLLHAAETRARPARARRVLVVCPSGMATTQLLVARLRARFPGHGSYEVVPLRLLGPEQAEAADLIISTVPLTLPGPTPVVQVHPSLPPADVATLLRWLD